MNSVRRILVSKVEEFPPGEVVVVPLDDEKKIAVFHEGDDFYAIQDECPHAHQSLSEGWVEEGVVTCSLHMWSFDLDTGKAVNAPPAACVKTYPTEIVGDSLYVIVS